jgi:hypothetical protein
VPVTDKGETKTVEIGLTAGVSNFQDLGLN